MVNPLHIAKLLVTFSFLAFYSRISFAQPRNEAKELYMDYFNQGIEFTQAGNWQSALGKFDTCVLLNGKYPFGLYNRGICKMELNQPEQALSDFNAAIANMKNFEEAYLWRSKCFDRLDKTELALEDINHAIIIAKATQYDYHTWRGGLLAKLNRASEAVPDFAKAYDLKPDDPQVIYSYAFASSWILDWKMVQTLLDKFRKLKPYDPEEAMLRMSMLVATNRASLLTTESTYYLKSEDTKWVGHYMDGYYKMMSQQWAPAINSLTESVKSGGVNPEVFYSLGLSYYSKKDNANACLWFKKAISLGYQGIDAMVAKLCK